MAKNDLKLPISVCHAPYLRKCRSYHRDFGTQMLNNDIYRCFSLFFFKCNNVNIKILFFIGLLHQFFKEIFVFQAYH